MPYTFTYPPTTLEFAPGLSALGAAKVGQPAAAVSPTATPAQAAAARGAPVRARGAPRPRPASAMTIPGYENPVPAGLRAFAGDMPTVMSGSGVYNPSNLPSGRTLNMRPTLSPAMLATLGAGQGFAGLGDPGVGSFLSTVGRMFDPTISGSITDRLTGGLLTGGGQPAQPAPPPPAPTPFTQVFAPQSNTQKYLLYGAGGLAAVLVLSMVMRRRGGTYTGAAVAGW